MAATTVDELRVLITAQSDQFSKELARVQKQLQVLDKNSSKAGGGISTAFGRATASVVALGTVVGNALTRAFGGLGNVVDDSVNRLDALKNYPRVMESLGYSAEDAKKSIDKLDQGVKGLPTSLDAIASSAQQLAPISPTLASATVRALAFNDALLAGGASAQEATGATENFTEMLATGRAYAEQWNALVQVMPGQMTQVAQSMLGAGHNAYQLRDAIEEGKFTVAQFADEFVKLDNQGLPGMESFKQQAINATGGIGTAIQNMRTAFVRGLANIMDAIGQANIAGFFNGISNAINAVVPYVIAVVKVIAAGVSFIANAIGSIFGRKATSGAKNVNQSADKTAKSMAKVATGAGNAASGIDDAAGNAKKLQKQLAGFDEMNVLQEPDAGSGSKGGGGIGGGTPFDFGDTDSQADKLNSTSEKVKRILDKIKNAFKALMDNPVVKGFVDVFKGIAQGIKWAWDKITGIELPEGLKNFFSAIGDFFKKIAQSAAVQELLYGLGIALGVIAAAYLAWGAALAIWSAITAVATAIGGAFAAVMVVITSPVFLVVAAIAALIAIVVLLVRNWDTITDVVGKVWDWVKEKTGELVDAVKSFFSDMWDGITGFFAGIGKWFGDRFTEAWNAIKLAFSLYIAFYKALWDGTVSIFSGVAKWFGNVFSGAWDAVKRAFSSVGDFFRGVWDTIRNMFTTIGTTIGDSIGGAFKAVVNSIIGFAQNTINGFIRAINTAIGAINKIPGVNISKLSLMDIPKLATGGVVDRATTAVIGEAGREAVLPLDRNTGWMDDLASKINSNRSGQPLQLVVKIGEDTILEKIISGVNEAGYMRNANVFTL